MPGSGVLLYELLTGSTPVDRNSLGPAAVFEILQGVVREVEPPRPSAKLSTSSALSLAANRGVEPAKLLEADAGELDWVVMKAAREGPGARTAGELARDVQRYLADEVVEARPPTLGYRMQKIARRNKGRLVAAAMLLLALVGGIVGTTGQAVRATRAERSAVRERDDKTRAWQLEAGLREVADSARGDALRQKSAAVAAEGAALAEADRHRRLLYASDIHMAAQVWQGENGTASQCDGCSAAHVPAAGRADLRGLLEIPMGAAQEGPRSAAAAGPPASLVSPTTTRSALDIKGVVTSWTLDGRREPKSLTLTARSVAGISLSRTGEVAALIDSDGSPRMYTARTGVQKGSFPAQSGPLTALKLSADGRLLVVLGRDGHARVWDVTVGKEIYDYQLLGARVPYLDLSLDGKLLLASAHPKTHMVALYRAGEPKPFILAGGEVGFGRYHGAISPDGRRAAVGDVGNNVCLYDTTTQKQLCVLRTRSSPVRLAFSPDGSQLAVGEVTGLVTIWGLASRQVVRVLKGHEATISVLAFAPNGRRLVSFDGNAVTRCWDLGVDEESRVLVKNDDQINSLSFSPDGRLLVAASQAQVQVHNLRSQDPPQSLSIGGTRTAVFSPDGRTIAGGMGGPLSLWQVETGHHLNLSSHLPEEIGLVVFSPDGRWLAVGFGGPTDFGWDKPGKVMLFDVENRKEHRTWPSTTQVSALAFSPDGALLAAAGHDGTIRFWRTAGWNELKRWEGPPGTAYASVLFLSGGQKLAAGNAAGTVDIWDVGTGRLAMRLSGHGSCVPVMPLSPDGRTLATGSWDRLIKLWDAGTGRELRTLRGHESWLYALAFSPDGNTLASSGVDGVLRLWEAPSAQAVAEMHVPRGSSIVD